MIVPEFKISQTQQEIIVVMRLPYIKVTNSEFFIEEHTFKFYLKPYLLTLNFEQSLQQAEEPSKATYFQEKYFLEVHLKKKVPGEHFENLNLLSKVLNKKKKNQEKQKGKGKKILIQVMNEQPCVVEDHSTQQLSPGLRTNSYSYGFNNNYTNVFENLEQQVHEIFSFNPQQVPIQNRYQLSNKIALQSLDPEAYLFDKYENEQIQDIIKSNQMEQSIVNLLNRIKSIEPPNYEEFQSALRLSKKELLVSPGSSQTIIKQLVSIAFSYLYELSCMQGDLSVESAKTINMSCAVLSCCINYQSVGIQEMIKDCCKRCMIYSLYKDVKICEKVVKLLQIKLSQNLLIAIINDLRIIFSKSEPRYLLNSIYMDDFAIYCMKMKLDEELNKVRKQLQKVQLNEHNLQFQFENDNDNEDKESDEQYNKSIEQEMQKISISSENTAKIQSQDETNVQLKVKQNI